MKISSIKSKLVDCGYRADLLRANYRISDDQTVKPMVGFAQLPLDARSSCVAVLESQGDPRSEVEQCRPTGAPLVFVCAENSLQWWRQGAEKPHLEDTIRVDRVDDFFEQKRDDFSPNAIYRAKTWGRFRTEFQLSFVDVGLMPLVEEEVGKSLEQLIERNVTTTKSRLGWDAISAQQGHWLLKSVFWLVSAKILRDKGVASFSDLDLVDVGATFEALGNHYGTPPIPISSAAKRDALTGVAEDVSRFSNLSLTTTESLAHVYENTLISKATRAELGTHSTPTYLVDYIVGNLSDWIQEIPEDQRSVFEPACGHAAFLVSAMRLLTELLPEAKATPGRRRQYLRKRIHGIDKDPFALELARLALTLTDLPNPDGWDLKAEDMFLTDDIETQAKASTILLANPPFEAFAENELLHYTAKNATPTVNNKAVEMLRRALSSMQPGSVFGFVMPQSMLHGKFAKDVRKLMLENFELREISLFPDKVFNEADVESVVLLGRRKIRLIAQDSSLRYGRVREWEMNTFKTTYIVESSKNVSQHRFSKMDAFLLVVPDLEEVWQELEILPRLSDHATLGQGLAYLGAAKLKNAGLTATSDTSFPNSQQGFLRFEPQGIAITELPKKIWMSLDPRAIGCHRTGSTIGIPQVLFNYARTSRGPWRLKGLIDSEGHAVASRLVTVRSDVISLQTLWAILNSPIANAFTYCHLGKRDNLVGVIRKMPIPRNFDYEEVERAVQKYFVAAASNSLSTEMRNLLADVDATILKQYDLPIELEYQLLSLFDGWERLGVPFKQSVLLPSELGGKVRFSDFIAYEKNWSKTNRRRGKLIDKKVAGTLTANEKTELNGLQAYAEFYLDRETPLPTAELEKLEDLILQSAGKKGDER